MATTNDFNNQVRGIIENILQDNKDFMSTHNLDYFAQFQAGQSPRATIVMCADSRGQTTSIDYTPDNDLFIIRNIGNSFENNKGSVEYGVLHLHTPVLMFIGHSECGAVKAVHSGIDGTLEVDIQKELAGMTNYIDKDRSLNDNIVENVKRQANLAYDYFRNLSKSGVQGVDKLVIIAAIYDFTNFLGNGFGKLNFLEQRYISSELVTE